MLDLAACQTVIGGEVARRRHAQGAGCRRDQACLARFVAELGAEDLSWDGTLGQVVDALETLAFAADKLADVQEPLGGDLGLAPVPPGPALLRAAELPG